MINKLYTKRLFVLLLMLASASVLVSCGDDEENASNEIVLLSYGPSPILRGGELQFIGLNLDKVTSVAFPGGVEVSDFLVKENGKLVVVVPDAAIPGDLSLKIPEGEIIPKTAFDILEPITIESISPLELKPGATLTLKGTYLNLIKEVGFALGKKVGQADFVSQTRTELKVKVPADAQSGPVTITNLSELEEELVIIESEEELAVVLPKITGLSPLPVKPGNNLTITGTDLDLTTQVVFDGGATVDEFVSVSSTKIVLLVPDNALEGIVNVRAASALTNASPAELTLVAPTITDIAPLPVKSGNNITITGTDLDLVTTVVFGGDLEGTIVSKSETQIEVTVPREASEDMVTLNTVAKSVVSSGAVDLIDPAITALSASSIKTNAELTITGTNMDLVNAVTFGGGIEGTIVSQTETEIIVKVPTGAETDAVTLSTINSNQIVSQESIEILPGNVPIITKIPSSVKPGGILVIEGEKMDFVVEVIFPNDIKATRYGAKSATLLEVYVPENVEKGSYALTLVTYENEMATTPEVLITGTDPVQDVNLVFFDFDSKGSWWGSVSVENDPGVSLDGSSYGHISGNFSGWSDLFWRNASDNFPGGTVGTDISGYVLKFDIRLDKPITDGNLKYKLQPDGGTEYWATIGPAGTSGEVTEATDGWITMTIPLTQFKDNYAFGTEGITDMSGANTTFGMAFDNGTADLDFYIDNVRFHKVD